MEDGDRAHFMTRRFDRDIDGAKYHVQTFCAMDHAYRNPQGMVGYERLFNVARKLGLGQLTLDEIFTRMVFNIMARNQDDHTKNHAFIMDAQGQWSLSPAYDICYAYKPGSRWIDQHQMSCNGKRDDFTLTDIYAAASAADIKQPEKIISRVTDALSYWVEIASMVGLGQRETQAIQSTFRSFSS
jgi:serine/threonine-protein kinase HipA